jgi:hypothetical protein
LRPPSRRVQAASHEKQGQLSNATPRLRWRRMRRTLPSCNPVWFRDLRQRKPLAPEAEHVPVLGWAEPEHRLPQFVRLGNLARPRLPRRGQRIQPVPPQCFSRGQHAGGTRSRQQSPPSNHPEQCSELTLGLHLAARGRDPSNDLHPHRLHDVGRVELSPQLGGQLTADDGSEIDGVGGVQLRRRRGLPARQPAQQSLGVVGCHAGGSSRISLMSVFAPSRAMRFRWRYTSTV